MSYDLDVVREMFARIEHQLDRVRAVQRDQAQVLHALSDAVAALALSQDGLSAAEAAALAARLQATAERLHALAVPTPSPVTERGPEMAVPQSINDALDDVNTATNEVATVITSLRDQVKVGMTQQDVDGVHDKLTAVADHLKAIAADPTDPVPPTPPQLMQGRQATQPKTQTPKKQP